jgi:uncharacterized membrane protein
MKGTANHGLKRHAAQGVTVMTIINYLTLYVIAAAVFFSIDLFWLGVVARNLYRENLRHLLSPSVNWTAAIVFYFVFIAGILFFSVSPGLKRGSLSWTVLHAGLFGFFTYATYELTNLATLKNWPLKLVFVDIGWGMVLCSTVAAVTFCLGKKLI